MQMGSPPKIKTKLSTVELDFFHKYIVFVFSGSLLPVPCKPSNILIICFYPPVAIFFQSALRTTLLSPLTLNYISA